MSLPNNFLLGGAIACSQADGGDLIKEEKD